MNLNKIEYKVLNDNCIQPHYASDGAAGLDLVACIEQDIELLPNAVTLIPTGIAIYIRDPSFAGLILPRSGLGHKHGIILGNGVGLIDSDYQGELKISCWNRSEHKFTITKGLRLAQLVFVPVFTPKLHKVKEFETTTRGTGGFGSTGTHSNSPASI